MRIMHFLSMGGYAWYVWPAYFFGLLILVANLGWSQLRFRRLNRDKTHLEREHKR